MKLPRIITCVGVLACIAAALFSVIIARDNSLRIQYHIAAMQRANHMVEVLNGAVPQTRRDRVARAVGMLLGKRTNSDWSDSCTHHQDALVRLGYLSRREFAFSGGKFPTGKFYTNFWPLMCDGTSSCAFMSNGVIRVFARPSQMTSWAALVVELESRQTP
jgi:hypothetical protein